MPRKYPQAQTGACILTLVQAAREQRGPSGEGQACCQRARERVRPAQAGYMERSIHFHGRAHLPPEAPFLPLTPLSRFSLSRSLSIRLQPVAASFALSSSSDPPPARPPPAAHLHPVRSAGFLGPRPLFPASLAGPAPGAPAAPRPLLLLPGDSGPFHNSAARLLSAPGSLPARFPGACALRSAAAAAVAAPSGSVLKGNAEASGGDCGEGDPSLETPG